MTNQIDWTYLDPSAPSPVQIGDIVCAEAGGLPIYRVTALEQGQVWVSPQFSPSPRAMPLDCFHWKARA
jgi:hypothetical protein